MTLDTQLRAQLTTAVADTTTRPGLARAALAVGRRRRRRRTTGALALATAAVVAAGGAVLLPDDNPSAREARVADGATSDTRAALSWARSLPQGPGAALPFFGEGGLWSGGTRYDVPGSVNRTVAPREVAGGWLVFLGDDYRDLRLAVLGADGGLTPLPPGPGGLDVATAVAVSADGGQVAYDRLLVDLPGLDTTELPHAPAGEETDGYYTGIRVIGFGDEGLVYEGAPFEKGIGTLWVLHPDGSSVQVPLPESTHVPQGGGADVAVGYDYASDGSDTCVTSWHLREGAWQEAETGCLGHALGEALSVSPQGDWLLTDDMPQVWNMATGEWDRVDMPDGVGKAQMDAQMGGAVWEDADSFLLPVSDRWDNTVPIGQSYVHTVQVVRCTMTTGSCERAGEEQDVTVTTSTWGTTELRFAQP